MLLTKPALIAKTDDLVDLGLGSRLLHRLNISLAHGMNVPPAKPSSKTWS